MLEKISFAVEYEWQYGGAQRLASILSKHYKKPLYFIGKGKCKLPVWDVNVINKKPKEPIVFSIVVDKYSVIKLKGKICVKFMHSAGTIENLLNNPKIKEVVWVTHRERVFKYGKKLGLRMYLIKNGYIPYDKHILPRISLKQKRNVSCIISRISMDKRINELLVIAQKANLPLIICGSVDKSFEKYLQSISTLPNVSTFFGCSEKTKENILSKSKVLLHGSTGKLRDYFEYSILDAMLYGVVPVCLTNDPEQFKTINKKKLGVVVTTIDEAVEAIKDILQNYEFYFYNVREFMKNFILSQPKILQAYTKTFQRLEKDLLS